MSSVIIRVLRAEEQVEAFWPRKIEKSKDRKKKTTPAGVPISITQATYLIHRIGNIFEQGKFTKRER